MFSYNFLVHVFWMINMVAYHYILLFHSQVPNYAFYLTGGALTSAKGAITNLWSSFTANNNNAGSGEESFTDAAIEAIESQANAEKPKEGDTGQEY